MDDRRGMANVFRSKLEEIMPAVELVFPPTPAFGDYRPYLDHAVSHPAKANTKLLEFLILKYTEEGDVVLDPMAGCYDEETEVLTKNGWKYFKEVTFDDEIATLNRSTNELEYQKPIRIIKQPYKGKMYYVRTKEVELKVTPDHNMYVAFRDSTKAKSEWKFDICPAKDVFGKHVIYSRAFVWKGRNQTHFTLEGAPSRNQFKYPPVKIPIELFLRFLGYYLAEGCSILSNGRYYVQIATDKKDKFQDKMIKTARDIASLLGRKVHLDARGRIWLNDKRLCLFLRKLGKATTKFIPREFLELPPDKLLVLLEALIEGDGSKRKNGFVFYTSSKQLADDVQELALKCGYSASVSPDKMKKSNLKGRTVSPTTQPYAVYISKITLKPRVYLKRNCYDAKRKGIQTSCVEEWVDYDGFVYCVEVPNHVILVRRNGKVVWCGNSGSTGVVAALHGRNAILVEIEPRFYEFIVKAKEKVERAETLTKKGWIVPILGDARRLSELLTNAVDVCVTSPPYAETELSGGNAERRLERLVNAGYDPRDYLGGRARNAVLRHYDEPPGEGHATAGSGENIGALPLGPVDAIVTSPPYVQQHQGGPDSPEFRHGCIRTRYPSKDSIGNLPLGPVDAVSLERGDGFDTLYRRLMTKNGRPTYLSEMLLVYHNMYSVLKPGGRAIVIVKPFIKNRQVIDLPHLTYLLMSRVGFALEALYKLRLEAQSFWRILFYRKNPDVPRLMHEYVIVAR
jgi:intein/homing endonuclease